MIQPKALQKGDTVGLVALACKVDFDLIKPAIEVIENIWGLNVVLGTSLTSKYHQFAGTDEIRANDFQLMLDDPNIKAIISARGGYGSSRLLDTIDFTNFIQNPKWVTGFSDITAVLCHIHTLGIESIHSTMLKLFMQDGGEFALETLRKVLFGESLAYNIPAHSLNKKGIAKGELVGGNLAMLTHIIGSNSDVDTAGKILFLEDVGEYLYSIDRMMIQLKRAGKLQSLAGLIVGHFSDLEDNEVQFGKNANEIIQDAVAEYNFPVCYGFPVGHEPENWALPCGRAISLSVEENGVWLSDDFKVL
ncbi:LD-carboxypeptidase [Arcicella sp. DC2W]|uniref:LD-carboxypeptidase n=1 Tax=Arcicella gelida TaxID=2984195 RepID=A0ABU5S9Q0_9BACT|nr:LD-carboxypeptidase [Arcicella sp. DC2W]MEA5404943.1 LD-carboxypeptidase [Arcicella sp. DC2W]